MIELVNRLAVQNALGEAVIWDHRRQRLWWTDIAGSELYCYDPLSGDLRSWATPERLCCFAPVHKGEQDQGYLIAAFASGFAYYHPQTGKLEWIAKVESDNPGSRLNDGRTDHQGRLWAGTMVESPETATYKGSLYCLNEDLTVSKTIGDLSISNSLCWSPNSKYLYHCDTLKRQIDRYQFDAQSAQLSNAKVFVKTDRNCFPDGSIIDAEGYLWNAQWGGSQVVRYAPDGSVDLVLPIPVSQPTCVAFGGKNLDQLFVTTAYLDLSDEARHAEPLAGDLFIFQTDHRGLQESPFKPATGKFASGF